MPTGGGSSRASNGIPKLSSWRVCAASIAGLSGALRRSLPVTPHLIPVGVLSLCFSKAQSFLQTQNLETLMNYDIYTEVTHRIIAQLGAGRAALYRP